MKPSGKRSAKQGACLAELTAVIARSVVVYFILPLSQPMVPVQCRSACNYKAQSVGDAGPCGLTGSREAKTSFLERAAGPWVPFLKYIMAMTSKNKAWGVE